MNNIFSVKYLHKYIHKGPDRTDVELTETNSAEHDEVKMFLDARIITPTEAIWRILEFPISNRSHSIKVLPVHLSGEQIFYLEEGMDDETIKEKFSINNELLAYFELNETSFIARKNIIMKYLHFSFLKKGMGRKKEKIMTVKLVTLTCLGIRFFGKN